MSDPLILCDVLNMYRAVGCRPELIELLGSWRHHGNFDITVAMDGGYRFGSNAEQKQLNFFKNGLSRARTLRETPHGRRCAVDCHPVGFDPHKDFRSQPGMRDKFLAWGLFAESAGFVWGGRFGTFGSDGDMPHVELKDWRGYSFPGGEPIP